MEEDPNCPKFLITAVPEIFWSDPVNVALLAMHTWTFVEFLKLMVEVLLPVMHTTSPFSTFLFGEGLLLALNVIVQEVH